MDTQKPQTNLTIDGQRDGEEDRRGDVEAIEEAQLGKRARSSTRSLFARKFAREEPAGVAPGEAVAARRMRVFRLVGVRVVVSMVRAHQSGPRCAANVPRSANTNCAAREVRKARCEK